MAGADNIIYMNGSQLLSAIQDANTAVSGMSYAEAAAALGASSVAQEGGAEIISFPLKKIIGGNVTYEAMYASQLWNYWKIAGEAAGTTALGAAAGAAYTWAQGALIGTGQGLAASAGLLTLSVPTAAAMAAPLLGVALGTALYKDNPVLWNKIAGAITDFCVKGTDVVTGLVTAAGQVLLPKDLIDALKSVFQEEEIPISTDTPIATSSLILSGNVYKNTVESIYTDNYHHGTYETITKGTAECYAVVWDGIDGSARWIFASTQSDAYCRYTFNGTLWITDELNKTYTHNGKTVYWVGFTDNNRVTDIQGAQYDIIQTVGTSETESGGQIAWTLIYGDSIFPGEYQTGTSKWEGQSTDLESLTEVPAYDPTAPGNTRPYYPVTIPIGEPTTPSDPTYPTPKHPAPGDSSDPDDPQTGDDPPLDPTRPLRPIEVPLLDPFIPPVVIPEIQWPEPLPSPEPGSLVGPGADDDPMYLPEPVLDPATDPTIIPDIEPAENLPTNTNPPQSTGESPPIAFPVPNVPFPTIMPPASETPVVSGDPGFIQVYHPTPSELVAFGRWLWVTYADASIDKIWNNPFDGVIGAHELYATPNDGGYTTIRCGFLDSGISSQLVRIRYSTINCGSLLIPEYWGNYLDYSPYSKAYVYLPFIGIQEVDVDDIVGHSVNICYHVDSYTGSCIAQITCAKEGYCNTIYQFSGNCSVEIPMAGGSQAAIKAAMMTADAYQHAANVSAGMSILGGLGSGLGSLLGGNIGGAIGGAINGIASGISQYAYGQAQHTANMVSAKSTVQHSGSFGASHGAMGMKIPYIIIRRPVQKVINGYSRLYGYPAHKQVVIGACTGYLRCREVHVLSPLATEEEKSMIEDLLKTGVYVTEE